MEISDLQSRFGLIDKGLPDLPGKGGKFNTTDIYGASISRKKKQSGNPRAGIYNDGDTGAIYATDGTYLGSISAEKGRQNQAINDAWTSMGTGLNGEKTVAFGSDKEGNELNSHHNIAEAIQHAYDNGTAKSETPTFNEATFSPQVQTAIERAKEYRDRAWSGAAAQEIYGKSKNPTGSGSANAGDQAKQSYFDSEKYQIDLKTKKAKSEASQA